MQLTPARPASSLRRQLGAAASLLLATVMPATLATAAPASAPPTGDAARRTPAEPSWQFEGSALFYTERDLATVVEPIARFTRLYPDGQTFSAQFGLDLMTGASPSGALPSSQAQTVTSPSGNPTTIPAGTRPTHAFEDTRGSLDIEWVRPLGAVFSTTLGGHYSRETDYQSVGGTAAFSFDVDHRLMTFTAGGGYNSDSVFPLGGAPVGMAPLGVAPAPGLAPADEGEAGGGSGEDFPAESKHVASAIAGLSRVLTRRWLVGLNWSRTAERGYLNEPYKVVSLVDPATGQPTGQLHENRPSSRQRTSVTASSVYHLSRDVLYLTWRGYDDDWGVRSQTMDVRLRHELASSSFLQPHVRAYTQTAADFFRLGLDQTAPIPSHASSDSRLGVLHTITAGATYGFTTAGYPGEFTLRVEVIHQWGENLGSEAPGVQYSSALDPPLDMATVHLGYTRRF